MNHSNSNIIDCFRKEYPDAMVYMEELGNALHKTSCPPCSTGKATRAPFKQDHQNMYALLEALSTDTTEPIAPCDSDGNKFIELLVDACTGWTNVQVMKEKSGAAKEIMLSLSKIQMMCKAKAQILHTDGAKEQNTKELRTFLDDNGTKASHTDPKSSQSNALAERRFRQLMAAARTAMTAAPHMPKKFWSHAVLDEAEKGNYMATAKNGKLEISPYGHIERLCPGAKVPNPATLFSWGTKGKSVSALKFKKKLEDRADEPM